MRVNWLITFLMLVVSSYCYGSDLVSFSALDADTVKTHNLASKHVAQGLEVTIAPQQSGSITFNALGAGWDLSQSKFLSIELENKSNHKTRFDPAILYTSPRTKQEAKKRELPQLEQAHIGFLKPLENLVYDNVLFRDKVTKDDYPHAKDFPGMHGLPQGVIMIWKGVDAKHIQGLKINFPAQNHERKVIIKRVFKQGNAIPDLYLENKSAYFPFINKYGQYKHADWPNKITDDSQFKDAIDKELKDLQAHPGSFEWDRFGGFANGPKFEATGHFRTQKINGKWWIINPDGHLFWSMGVNSAGKLTVGTPIKDREHFFEGIPKKSKDNKQYFNGQYYYHGLRNLHRKYGPDSEEKYLNITLDRMKSWGLNTLGGWSNERAAFASADKKLPYTVFVGALTPEINAKFPDVFDPKWKEDLERKIISKAKFVKNDPYFFGFFINNEIHWGTPYSLALDTLAQSKSSSGKKQYIALLKQELKTIGRFNQLTGGKFKSWSNLLNTKVEKSQLTIGKLKRLNTKHYKDMVEMYFKTSRELIDKHAPGKLYLGCRWHGTHKNNINVAIAAKYVDILTFNAYENEVEHYPFPAADIDKPFIISEFNFGSLDRGKFFTGLGYAASQRNRGEKYQNFIEGALRNPRIVGAHWFMWANSTTAGRGNGENASCGLVSMTDQIYYELIGYLRETNYQLYNYRVSH